MKFRTFALSFLATATQVLGNPLPSSNDDLAIDGLATDDMFTDFDVPSFTGAFGLNGEEMTLNGTIQEVIAQVSAINPSYDWGLPPADMSPNTRRSEFGDVWPGATPDDWLDVRDIQCTVKGLIGAYKDPINEGLHHLRNLKGWTQLKRGMKCVRASCSWDSGIFMCYESRGYEGVTFPWRYVGEMGVVLRDKCIKKDHVHGKLWAYTGMVLYFNYSKC